jgi:hypothetical protein
MTARAVMARSGRQAGCFSGKAMTKRNSKSRAGRGRGPTERARPAWIWIGVAVLGLLAVVAAASLWPRTGQAPQVSEARLASDPSLGPATAPLTLVEYGDFG